jgi:N-dimethylarginine dimethylaminohydrolase
MIISSPVASAHSSTFCSSPQFDRPTFLMCTPQWYDVDYVINPWMAGNLHRSTRDKAFAQWRSLHQALLKIADIRLLHARPGSPDMVFVAHTALVHNGVAAVSSFAHPQRQSEEAHLREWLQDAGFLLCETPRETTFEGEGDALFDIEGETVWAAHGVRTCLQSHRHLSEAWHTPVKSLHLIDPRFYHLDLCFAPLAGGYLLYFPGAFDPASRARIEAAYAPERRIAVTEAEATQFACNVINIGETILMHKVSGDLAARLADFNFDVKQLDLSEFLKAGGSAKSMALRLSNITVVNA